VGRNVRVPVPYEDTTLPGYLLRPDGSGTASPTLVMTNGSDGSLAALIEHGGTEALARGWNVFVYDGPGQQSIPFQRGVPFRHDWEAVFTPVVDALLQRPEVDPDAMLGYAVSQGGYWLPRRWPSSTDWSPTAVWSTWPPPGTRSCPRRSSRCCAPDGRTRSTRRWRTRPPAQLWELLPTVAERAHYTAANGANFHCPPMAKATVSHDYLDWLTAHLPSYAILG
jgi:hypothetical protein